jgi:hypothetical protein
MPYKGFTPGEVLTANDVNGYLMRQSVPQFPDFAAGVAGYVNPPQGALFVISNGTVYVKTATTWSQFHGRLARKTLTGSAGADGVWTDVSGGGLAVAVGSGRIVNISVRASFYFVGANWVGMRIERPSGVALCEVSDRFSATPSRDLISFNFDIDDQPPSATNTYYIKAATGHTATIPILTGAQNARAVYAEDKGAAI